MKPQDWVVKGNEGDRGITWFKRIESLECLMNAGWRSLGAAVEEDDTWDRLWNRVMHNAQTETQGCDDDSWLMYNVSRTLHEPWFGMFSR